MTAFSWSLLGSDVNKDILSLKKECRLMSMVLSLLAMSSVTVNVMKYYRSSRLYFTEFHLQWIEENERFSAFFDILDFIRSGWSYQISITLLL